VVALNKSVVVTSTINDVAPDPEKAEKRRKLLLKSFEENQVQAVSDPHFLDWGIQCLIDFTREIHLSISKLLL
jgi:hypothetical protein